MVHSLARSVTPDRPPGLRMRGEAGNEALRTVAGMIESECGAGAGEGGGQGEPDRKSVPLQKHLPTGFVG
jgi:hypothetical protein